MTKNAPDPNVWTHAIDVAGIPPQGLDLELKPDAAVRAELARLMDVIAVNDVVAKLDLRAAADGSVEVQGTLRGSVRQVCVVTLEEFDNPVEETIEARFSAALETDEDDEDLDGDVVDPIVDGKIDAGALATEFLSLAIDPYPRLPGAEFRLGVRDEAAESVPEGPFDRLTELTKNRKKDG
jgi:uncharacterized metal-binding protein YceD (DUF177 family)